jgi:cysteine desulfurase
MERKIYLDYCATTPVHPTVRMAMLEGLEESYGNPSSMHWAGKQASEQVQIARQRVARGIGCEPEEIIFTSGATEADNLALSGIMRQHSPGNAHLITAVTEHHAVLHTAEQLEKAGYKITCVPVDSNGCVDPDSVRRSIRPETVLISIMLVNNETGVIQPVAEIGRIAREYNILIHTDAVQGAGLLDLDVASLHVDLLSLSGHKIYGPKGIGALYVRKGIRLLPQIFGGPQEFKIRPGTENVPGIIGLGAAVEWTYQHKTVERPRLARLRQRLVDGLKAIHPALVVNSSGSAVSPHVLSVGFPGADAEMMLIRLNGAGIAVSMGSACTTQSIEPSHVLKAMGLPRDVIESTLRISMGYQTTHEEIDEFLAVFESVLRRALVN